MTIWTRVRDGVLARTHELGRQVALALVDGLRRAVASDRRVFVLGRWPEVFAALGVPAPRSGKAARAALAKLEELAGGFVVRVTSHFWRVASHAADLMRTEQLELVWDGPAGPTGKGEREPETPTTAAPPAPPASPSPRAPARSLDLERAFGRLPADAAARLVAAKVDELGAVERGKAWSVTITAAPGADVRLVAEAFGAALSGEGRGCWLVPEYSPKHDLLHWHGIAIGTEQQLQVAGAWCGAGETCVSQIRDLRRLRYWASYSRKGPAEDVDTIASGLLADGSEDDAQGEGDGDLELRGGEGGNAGGAGSSHARAPQAQGAEEVGGQAEPRAVPRGVVGAAAEGLRAAGRAARRAWRWLKGRVTR